MHLVTSLLSLLAMGWLVWLPGWCLERRFFRAPREAGARFFVRWVLGFLCWTVLLFTLAASGNFSPASIVSLVLVVAGAWHCLAISSWLGERRLHRPEPVTGSDPGVRWIGLGLSLLVLGPVFCIAINPTVSWDAAAYHLTLPRLYLEHGGFRPVEMNVYSHWPHSTELLFGAAMAFANHVLAKIVHFGFGLLTLAGLWRVIGGGAAWLGMALFALNGVVLLELRVAYVDLAHAFFLLAAGVLASWAADARHSEHPRAVLVAGLAAGLLVGVKVTGVVSAAFIGLLLLPRLFRDAMLFGRRRAALGLLAFILPVVVLLTPWLLKASFYTGNPVYPWAWSFFGGQDWNADLGRQLAEWQRGIGMGREPLDYLLLPLRAVMMGGEGYSRFDGEIGLFWLIAGPAALWATRRPGLVRRLVSVALLHAVWWAMTSQQMRFLIPVLALLAVAGAVAGRDLCRRWLGEHLFRRRLLALALALSIGGWASIGHGRILTSGWRHFQLYLRPGFTLQPESARAPIFESVARLPENAKLLFLNTNQGFHCPREYLADSFFEASQISAWLGTASSPSAVGELMARRGISHLLLDRRPLGVPYPRALLELLDDPGMVQPVAEDGRFSLLAVRPPAGPGSGPPS